MSGTVSYARCYIFSRPRRTENAPSEIGGGQRGSGLVLLSGCADMQDVLGSRDDDEPRTLAFECDNNQDLRVRLSSDREEARVEVDDQEFLLEEAGRDNGQRVYSDNNDVRLTVSDDEAYLRIPGEADYQDCERT
jgi:hypothetical protein